MGEVAVRIAAAGPVCAIDLFTGGDRPLDVAPGAIQVEPQRWWAFGGDADAIDAALGGRGAASAIGGGLVRAAVTGDGWRDLLSVAALFDSHDPGLVEGRLVATLIHHVPVWIHVSGADGADIYAPASYAPALSQLWRASFGARAVVFLGDAHD